MKPGTRSVFFGTDNPAIVCFRNRLLTVMPGGLRQTRNDDQDWRRFCPLLYLFPR